MSETKPNAVIWQCPDCGRKNVTGEYAPEWKCSKCGVIVKFDDDPAPAVEPTVVQQRDDTAARIAELERALAAKNAEIARLNDQREAVEYQRVLTKEAVYRLCEELHVDTLMDNGEEIAPWMLIYGAGFRGGISQAINAIRKEHAETKAELFAANDELDANDKRLLDLVTMCDGETKLPDGTHYNAQQLLGEIREFVNEVSTERDALLAKLKDDAK